MAYLTHLFIGYVLSLMGQTIEIKIVDSGYVLSLMGQSIKIKISVKGNWSHGSTVRKLSKTSLSHKTS